jgi:hypothetical protein
LFGGMIDLVNYGATNFLFRILSMPKGSIALKNKVIYKQCGVESSTKSTVFIPKSNPVIYH